MIKKILKYGLLLIVFGICYITYDTYPKLDIVSGFSSKSIASHFFIANRGQNQTENEDNNIPSMNLAESTLDESEKTVTSKALHLKKRIAYYKDGLGTVLIPPGKEIPSLPIPNRNKSRIEKPYPFGNLAPKDTVLGHVNYTVINNAIDSAFTKKHKTRSVLILHKGHLIAERYAPHFDQNSMILGWSMTKSITSIVVGVLAKQNKISLEQNNLFSTWENDDRKNITLKNLLNMNSGLSWDENYNEISDVTRMLFLASKMSDVQLNKEFAGNPNQTWNYSSGTTNLIAEFIRNQFSSHQDYLDFWYEELIDKIGMHSMIIEPDYSGTYVGSSYGWATTRDWARFGQFCLQNGHWNDEQIVTTSWMEFCKTPTNGSNGEYGGHFWLNAGGFYPDLPRDLYSCNGYQGQYVFIIPSKDLVVVRTGLEEHPVFDANLFLKEIIAGIN